MGELTGRELSPDEQAELAELEVRFLEMGESKDLSGTAYRGEDGKVHAPCTERRLRRMFRANENRRGRATEQKKILQSDNNVLRHQRDDAAALGAAHVRRESVVAHLGSLPEGPVGDALRALNSDARQVYQLRQALNSKGRRNTWAEVAEQFRSERKPGKRYTRARVQQIYRDAVKAFPALRDYADALTARDSIRLDRDPTESEEIEAITNEQAFDLEELSPDRPEGVGYRATRDLRNRGI